VFIAIALPIPFPLFLSLLISPSSIFATSHFRNFDLSPSTSADSLITQLLVYRGWICIDKQL